MRSLFALSFVLAACGPELLTPPPSATGGGSGGGGEPQQQTLNLAGNYRCTLQGVDTTVFCGGMVYRSDLRGSDLPLTVTQTGTRLQLGVFGLTLEGSLYANRDVTATYTDSSCSSCSPSPVQLELRATAGEGQLSDVTVKLWQLETGYSDCEKSYRGVCAR